MDEVGASNLEDKNNKIYLDRQKVEAKVVYHFIKRAIDICGSSLGLIVLSPLFLIVGYMIKKEDSGGPIFFSQDRVGKNGEVFKMYKFRSMCVDAEEKLALLLEHNEVDGAMFKMKDDPRVTKIGKFIRKTSIDELPQLWNVLKGEMSLVGPRPPVIREVHEYSEYDKQRLYVKPGCTGLWQVSGRNHVGFEQMVQMDLEYIKSQNLLFDIEIIFKTVLVIVRPNGAY
ncbi:sugar transferase [Enterococcus casseliflavus]|uniref:sugar transferase n=1 Tax=Enterococcus casseliflavus TaxID=37734 RepID=UPI00288D544B|nr:sugar transferase [Enterococcus casseliflavus]MDT2988009.1 sugar transferase [Enterococcus casseliflavus]